VLNLIKQNELFYKSLQKTRSASAQKSCTIHLNGKFWCMHDGYWYGCNEGRDENSFIKAICSRYNGPNKPAECTAVFWIICFVFIVIFYRLKSKNVIFLIIPFFCLVYL